MSSLFCCANTRPYRSQRLSHEEKFSKFMAWASFPKAASPSSGNDGGSNLVERGTPFAVQLVQQVNYGPLESKRYFVPIDGQGVDFMEVAEMDLIQANFKKLNTYKNYKCVSHNKFFEVNIYQKNPVNDHHWRADISRPAGLIDL